MTTRTFAPWVEPIATQLGESRAAIADVARSVPAEAWERPSPLGGWTYRDLLAHLAAGDWVCQSILSAAVAGRPADLSILNQLDERNEQLRREREGRSIEELIAEVESEGEETQELLARLTDEDESRRQEGAPMSLGEYLCDAFPGHDRRHLEELRTALEMG
ncbi:MAG: maleylpyruvate isomerase N-terminal domain-containing protein [Dehalococcoidia bacterium]|nr:maleylpyruvate isomerase N-terminal domain-containing protein [Dehalococcoidia bacterium]